MSFLRVLIGIVLALFIALAGAIAYLHFTDLSKFSPQIETAVSNATGREFKLDGGMDIKFFPAPSLTIEGLSLANAPWGSEPLMAQVGHFSATIDPWSLLRGPIVIKEFRFNDVRLLLEKNAGGEANWEIGSSDEEEEVAADPATAPGDAKLPLMINLAEISNITVIYREPEAEEKVVYLEHLSIAPNQADDLVLDGAGKVLQFPLALSGSVGPIEEVESLGAVNYAFEGQLGRLDVKVDGQMEKLDTLDGATLAAIIKVEELRDIMEAAELDLPLSGPMLVEANLAQASGGTALQLQAKFSDVDVQLESNIRAETIGFNTTITTLDRLGKALGVEGLPPQALTLDGALGFDGGDILLHDVSAKMGKAAALINGTVTADGGIDVQLEADGPSLADLDPELPPIPFKLSAASQLAQGELVIDPLDLRFGKSDLSGNIVLRDEGQGKFVLAKLRSELIDMSPFSDKEEAQSPDKAAAKEPPATDTKAGETNQEFVFQDEPLPFGALKHNEIDVDVLIKRYRSNHTELHDIKLMTTLHKQDLNGKASFVAPHGGKTSAEIDLNTAGDVATFALDMSAADLRINIASGDVKDPNLIPAIGINIDIKSKGNTPRALASSSNGRILLTQGPGKIENAVLDSVSGDILAQLFSALNPFAKDEKYTNWECSIIGLDITDGLTELTAFLLQGEKIIVLAGGDVDLNTEELNIEFNTKPRKGIGITADMFVTPFVKLKGTLAQPAVGLNEKGAILTTGAAVATAGLSILVKGAMDRATAEGDHCDKTMDRFLQGKDVQKKK